MSICSCSNNKPSAEKSIEEIVDELMFDMRRKGAFKGPSILEEFFSRPRPPDTDSYIRGLLIANTGLNREDVPQWLVELKRYELELKREIRRRKQKGLL